MRALFFPIVFFLLLNVIVVLSVNKTFGKCLPFTFIFCSLCCYAIGAIGLKLKYSFFVILIFGIIFLIKNIKKLQIVEYRKKIFSIGFYIFIVIYFILFICDYGKTYLCWDDFAHWGPMLRVMVNNDILYTAKGIAISHKNYPAFMQCFEYIWCTLQGGLYEWGAINAIHLFGFSVVAVPLIDRYFDENRNVLNVIKSVVLILVLITLTLTFDVYLIYNSVYLDIVVGMYAGYLFVLVDNVDDDNELFDKILLIISIIGFVLLKDVCMVFMISMMIFYLAKKIFIVINNRKISINKKDICNFLIIVILPLFVYFVWKICTKNIWINDQFNIEKLNIKNIIDVMLGKGNDDQVKVRTMYGMYIILKLLSDGILKTTLLMNIILTILLLSVIYILNRKKMLLLNYLSYVLYIIISAIGYIMMFFIIYEFFFSRDEMLSMASYTRYMNTYTLSMVYFVIYVVIKYSCLTVGKCDLEMKNYEKRDILHKEKKIIKKSMLWIAIFGIIYVLLVDIEMFGSINEKIEMYSNIKKMVSLIRKNNIQNKNIYVLMSDDDFVRPIALDYYAEGIKIDRAYMNNDLINQNISQWDMVKEEIAKNDYLYILTMSDVVNMQLKVANGNKDIYNKRLYKIIKGDELIIE